MAGSTWPAGRAQCGHSRRTRRWACSPLTGVATRNGSTPMSIRRVKAPIASLVCTVDSTRWPVSADWMAISAVSRSRISPTMITSGSWRRIERSALANVSPMSAWVWIWVMRGSWNSTGSSTVMIFFMPSSAAASVAYRVVDLPEPVGPVTSRMPWASRLQAPSRARWSGAMPSRSSPRSLRSFGNRRSTMDSPCTPGNAEARTSMAWPLARTLRRPSCGKRRSAMSMPEISFRREATALKRSRGNCSRAYSTPSIRKRTTNWCSSGSRWMSEARCSTACASRLLTSSTTGASSASSRRWRTSSPPYPDDSSPRPSLSRVPSINWVAASTRCTSCAGYRYASVSCSTGSSGSRLAHQMTPSGSCQISTPWSCIQSTDTGSSPGTTHASTSGRVTSRPARGRPNCSDSAASSCSSDSAPMRTSRLPRRPPMVPCSSRARSRSDGPMTPRATRIWPSRGEAASASGETGSGLAAVMGARTRRKEGAAKHHNTSAKPGRSALNNAPPSASTTRAATE